MGQNTAFINAPFTAGYFYAWRESVRPEDETPQLMKFILNRWYVLVGIRVDCSFLWVWSARWMWTRFAGWILADPGL